MISDATPAIRMRVVLLSVILVASIVAMILSAPVSPALAAVSFVLMLFAAVGLFTSAETEFVETITSRKTESFIRVEDLDIIVILTTMTPDQFHHQYELDRDSITVRISANPRVEITDYRIERVNRNAYGWMTSRKRDDRTSAVIWVERKSMARSD